jgi:DNA-binding PucR family transcriptional regulator
VERVEALLAGESLDTSRLSYDFDVHHIALVAVGLGAATEMHDRMKAMDLPSLVVEAQGGPVWGWLGKRASFQPAELQRLVSLQQAADLRLAIGEPAHGLGGWRLTHHQARAALAVAERGAKPVARYADVALLSSVLRDDLLATSLRRLYLEPLEGDRDGGAELRRTLRAYFAAGRNVSVAGGAIGVTRQAVARRIRAAEEKLGRPIAACGADLEIALRLEALESAPTLLSAP